MGGAEGGGPERWKPIGLLINSRDSSSRQGQRGDLLQSWVYKTRALVAPPPGLPSPSGRGLLSPCPASGRAGRCRHRESPGLPSSLRAQRAAPGAAARVVITHFSQYRGHSPQATLCAVGTRFEPRTFPSAGAPSPTQHGRSLSFKDSAPKSQVSSTQHSLPGRSFSCHVTQCPSQLTCQDHIEPGVGWAWGPVLGSNV